jgi:hypothetical protein
MKFGQLDAFPGCPIITRNVFSAVHLGTASNQHWKKVCAQQSMPPQETLTRRPANLLKLVNLSQIFEAS